MPFTASIIERTFTYVPDRILKLSGAAYLRPLGGAAISAPWERIRIGMLCAVNHPAANLTDIMFLMGLCAGQDMPGCAYNTRNFIGASISGLMTVGATRTSTYAANSGNPYVSFAAGQFFQKVGASVTWSANASNTVSLPIVISATTPAVYQRRGLIILDITKTIGGTGALTMTLYNTLTAATLNNDIRPDHLQQALDQPGVPSVRGLTFASVFSSTGVNYSPLLIDVDTLEIFYSNFNYPLEISAIGVTIIRNTTYYSGTNAAGISDESFEEYTPSTGSISSPTFLNGGSGWSSAGAVAGFDSYGSSSSNLFPQSYASYVGTTSTPDDPFEQYVTGTVISNVTVCLGSFWTAPATVYTSMENSQPQYGLAGTSTGTPFDTFETYTVNNGSTSPTTSSFADGSYWASTGTVIHSGSVLYAGTTTPNYPMFGSTVLAALAGTTYGTPFDTFEAYAVGTIVSGVTVNAGSYWEGYGTVTTFSYP